MPSPPNTRKQLKRFGIERPFQKIARRLHSKIGRPKATGVESVTVDWAVLGNRSFAAVGDVLAIRSSATDGNCAVLNSLYRSVNGSIPDARRFRFTPSDGWTIEDEQCQKIGGGYEAVKFRFLLFLWTEPTCYLRRSKVQRHES